MPTEKIFATTSVKSNTYHFQQTEQLQEIIVANPGVLIGYGHYFFLLILLSVGLAGWFIQYPDVIRTSARLTSIHAPKPVTVILAGKLVALHIKEGERVEKNQVLGFMESTAHHPEVLQLAAYTDTIQLALSTGKSKLPELPIPTHLGELQPMFQVFSQALLSFRTYLPSGLYSQKRTWLEKDFTRLAALHKQLLYEKTLKEQDLALSQKTFEVNERLRKDHVISEADYRIEQSKLISKQLSLSQIHAVLIQNETQQADKQKEMQELQTTLTQQTAIFQQALQTFKSQIDDWKRKYVFTAPLSGHISFASFIQENQQLYANQTLCYINPTQTHYFAEVLIPQANLGKIALHQSVLLKFPSYPFQEYGVVEGRLESMLQIPTDSGYVAHIALPAGLKTNYHHTIQYREGLRANAEIITKDLRLLERFYYSLRGQLNH